MSAPDLRWCHMQAGDFRALVNQALERKRQLVETILSVPAADRTFANTIDALADSDDVVSDAADILQVLSSVHPDEAVRNAAFEEANRLDAGNILLLFRRDLWRAFKEWDATGRQPEDPADDKLASDTRLKLRRMGFTLDNRSFWRLKAISTELERLQKEFEQVISEWDDGILVSERQLRGMPQRYIEQLHRTEDGRFRISLEDPDLFPFLRCAHDDAARRDLALRQLRVGGMENMNRLERMVQLRGERASLLGYASHADYACELRMAGKSESVQSFLQGLLTRLEPLAAEELGELMEIKRRALNRKKPAPISFHEFAYWSERLLRERYDFDEETVRPYFPLERVLAGMFDVFGEPFRIRYRTVQADTWDPSVHTVEVADATSGDVYGHILFDLFPRSGKYGYPASLLIRGSADSDRAAEPVQSVVICSLTPPLQAVPSLLSLDEIETLFHEFGHALHAVLSPHRRLSQNAFGVELDFIEMTSQLFEEWAWDARILKRISGHWQTGEPLSDALVKRAIAARGHMRAQTTINQALQAFYDMSIHSMPADTPADSSALARIFNEMVSRYRSIEFPEEAIFPAGWSHLADYDAGYYSYLWSKVHALDVFTVFAPDPLNSKVCRSYRSCVLEPGATAPARRLLKRFLGREPSTNAFMTSLGITES
ncbi:Zn-dependent oligopeptidase [bacterium]|nr:Zn-dependent oligopeptidase [bacterium]